MKMAAKSINISVTHYPCLQTDRQRFSTCCFGTSTNYPVIHAAQASDSGSLIVVVKHQEEKEWKSERQPKYCQFVPARRERQSYESQKKIASQQKNAVQSDNISI